jgi:hypothetical protein
MDYSTSPIGVPAEHGEDRGDVPYLFDRKTVIDDESLPFVFEEAGVPEIPQVPGGLRLGDPEYPLHLTHAQVPVAEDQPHDGEAGVIRQGFEDPTQLRHGLSPRITG